MYEIVVREVTEWTVEVNTDNKEKAIERAGDTYFMDGEPSIVSYDVIAAAPVEPPNPHQTSIDYSLFIVNEE